MTEQEELEILLAEQQARRLIPPVSITIDWTEGKYLPAPKMSKTEWLEMIDSNPGQRVFFTRYDHKLKKWIG